MVSFEVERLFKKNDVIAVICLSGKVGKLASHRFSWLYLNLACHLKLGHLCFRRAHIHTGLRKHCDKAKYIHENFSLTIDYYSVIIK